MAEAGVAAAGVTVGEAEAARSAGASGGAEEHPAAMMAVMAAMKSRMARVRDEISE
jgi:hypothetical protein